MVFVSFADGKDEEEEEEEVVVIGCESRALAAVGRSVAVGGHERGEVEGACGGTECVGSLIVPSTSAGTWGRPWPSSLPSLLSTMLFVQAPQEGPPEQGLKTPARALRTGGQKIAFVRDRKAAYLKYQFMGVIG